MTIATGPHCSTTTNKAVPVRTLNFKSISNYYRIQHLSTVRSMHPSLPMSSRTGRTTARYTTGTNRRLCAGVVALSTNSTADSPGHYTHVLVTSSSRHPNHFVLPKGGWEQDESAEQSALREGWEEGINLSSISLSLVGISNCTPKLFCRYANCVAGVVGKVTKFLGQVVDPRPPNVHDKTKKHKVNGISSMESSKEPKSKPRAEYLYYEVEVERLESEYPESDERSRKWVLFPLI